MRKIEKRAVICMALAILLAAGMSVFLIRYFAEGGKWASSAFNRHLYDSNGVLISGTVLDRDGDVLSSVENGHRTYYENETVRKATLHAVGDLYGKIGTGVLNAFADKLTGFDLVNGAFGAERGSNLYLTLDARYNYEAYRALGGHAGTVAVYNYKTGEILCMVSAPSYDPLNVPKNLEENDRYKGAYLNRFLSSAFVPGSVFKTVTLTAALENLPDAETRTWNCTGSVQIGDETITCSGVHGEQTLKEAFAHSCNAAFAQIAEELGADTLRRYTEKAGLTSAYSVDGLPTAKGTFNWDGITAGQLGWAGVGQYHDQVNPCAFLLWMGAIANGGKLMHPTLVDRVRANDLSVLSETKSSVMSTAFSSDTASKLTTMMKSVVTKDSPSLAPSGVSVAAKTGTAQIGVANNAIDGWVMGFAPADDPKIAVAVVVHNTTGYGVDAAGPIFRSMIQEAMQQ